MAWEHVLASLTFVLISCGSPTSDSLVARHELARAHSQSAAPGNDMARSVDYDRRSFVRTTRPRPLRRSSRKEVGHKLDRRMTLGITSFGTHVETYPPTLTQPTDVNTVTLYYDAENYWPGSSVKAEILTDRKCTNHPVPGWVTVDGTKRDDLTLGTITEDFEGKSAQQTYNQVQDQVFVLLESAQTQFDILIPANVNFYHQRQADVTGHWALLIATFTNTPGYSFCVQRTNPSTSPSTAPAPNGQALGAAMFLVVITAINIFMAELHNPHDGFDPAKLDSTWSQLDAQYIKVFLTVGRDIVRQGNRAIANAGGMLPTPSLADIQLAIDYLATGNVSGIESGTGFLTMRQWVQNVRNRQDCGGSASEPPDPNIPGPAQPR